MSTAPLTLDELIAVYRHNLQGNTYGTKAVDALEEALRQHGGVVDMLAAVDDADYEETREDGRYEVQQKLELDWNRGDGSESGDPVELTPDAEEGSDNDDEGYKFSRAACGTVIQFH